MFEMKQTYTDYNGEERTEIFRFNFTEQEAIENGLHGKGEFYRKLEDLRETKDIDKLIPILKWIVLNSYGIKSNDGRFFRKSEEIRRDFEASPAFSKIYMALATDDKLAAEFVNGISPSENGSAKIARPSSDIKILEQ